ncbi:MAG: peptidylprolyl isomerase [Candidatus Hydrogenedentota bacterium]
MFRSILREPLVHFLVLGVAIFGVASWFRGDGMVSPGERVIVVDEAALLQFMQFRERAFDGPYFRDALAAMTPSERQLLIDDYVREEALYREALAMGLDADDYIIRRRLVQKVEFITESLARPSDEIPESVLEAYFAVHREDFYVAPHVTFTHVFVDAERRGWDEARDLAETNLAELNAGTVPFEDAARHGDRFPFFVNYVERTRDFIETHFGQAMAETIFASRPSATAWQGPFESPYGVHLVLLTARAEGRDPQLDEVRGLVKDAAAAEHRGELLNEAVSTIIGQYEVRVEYPAKESQ